jgi:hypothetical protein
MERRESEINSIAVRKLRHNEANHLNEQPLTPEEALGMMWQLTCNAWAFMPNAEQPDDSIESRLQRFSRVFKRRKS